MHVLIIISGSNAASILGFLRIDAASKEDQKVIKINVFFGYRCMELYIGTHLQMHGLVFKYLRYSLNLCQSY